MRFDKVFFLVRFDYFYVLFFRNLILKKKKLFFPKYMCREFFFRFACFCTLGVCECIYLFDLLYSIELICENTEQFSSLRSLFECVIEKCVCIVFFSWCVFVSICFALKITLFLSCHVDLTQCEPVVYACMRALVSFPLSLSFVLRDFISLSSQQRTHLFVFFYSQYVFIFYWCYVLWIRLSFGFNIISFLLFLFSIFIVLFCCFTVLL